MSENRLRACPRPVIENDASATERVGDRVDAGAVSVPLKSDDWRSGTREADDDAGRAVEHPLTDVAAVTPESDALPDCRRGDGGVKGVLHRSPLSHEGYSLSPAAVRAVLDYKAALLEGK